LCASALPQPHCSVLEVSKLCRTTAHFTFVVGPDNGDGKLDELSIIPVDPVTGEARPGEYVNFEKHIVNGVCGDPDFNNCSSLPNKARVYNWGYEVWGSYNPQTMQPSSVSVKVGLTSATSESGLVMPVVTIPYQKTILSGTGNAATLNIMPNNASSCSYQNGDEVIFHFVFSVAAIADAAQNLTGTGQFSVDGGKTWQQSSKLNIFFEDHIDLKNVPDGQYYQGWQYDERWKGHADEVCYKVNVTDGQHHAAYQNCMKVCKHVVPFHYAAGYCPN